MDYKVSRRIQKRLDVRTDERGALLLVAIVLLGVITLSAIYLSLVLLAEIRSTRYADNGLASYYVAESGGERSLWRLKISKEQASPALFTNLTAASNMTDQCAGEDGGIAGRCVGRCSNDSTIKCQSTADCGGSACDPGLGDPERLYDFTTVSLKAGDFTAYDITPNQSVSMDVYDPTVEGQINASTGVSELVIGWYVSACSGVEQSARLQISYTPIDAHTLEPVDLTYPPVTRVDVCGCSQASYDTVTNTYKCADSLVAPSYQLNLLASSFYRIVFRSADVPVKKISVTGNDDIPSLIQIATRGIYRESESVVTLRAQWRDALSGIFNYVLFSEESLIKDTRDLTGASFKSLCGFCSASTSGNKFSCSADPDCQTCSSGKCIDGTTNCTTSADCTAMQCTTVNTVSDTIDGSASSWYCPLDTSGESDGSVGSINQTDANSCNVLCNGRTFCGDGYWQATNGIGNGFEGHEQCDEGAANSDTVPLTCRTDCRDPFCGDGVTDNGPYTDAQGALVIPPNEEECDDADADNTDECNTLCKLTTCGDGIVQSPDGQGISEECDQGVSNAVCDVGVTCSPSCTTC